MGNKKGMSGVFSLIALIFCGLMALLGMAVIAYSAGWIDTTFSSIDFQLGNVSFNETYNQTMKPVITSLETTIPQMMSMGLILGMVLVMMLVSYFTPSKNKLWAIVDIVVLIIVEVFAVAVKEAFEESIINISPEFYQIFITTLAEPSKWVLQMPLIIPAVGLIMMAITYILKSVKPEEGGFYQVEE